MPLQLPLGRLDFPESELVIAFVYAAGTDSKAVLEVFVNGLAKFGYHANVIRLSDFLGRYELEDDLVDAPEDRRISSRMDAGNHARLKTARKDLLALAAVSGINRKRAKREPLEKTAHILLSLKRPEEVVALRRIYGNGFYAIGVFATTAERMRYLVEDRNVPKDKAKALIERDQEEADEYGQRTRDTFHLADAFVRARPDDLRSGLWRCLDLIFGDPFVTPMPEENAMFLAYAASTRSGDLGRQVGAAVTSARGDVIAVGCNDVPRFGGGLYWPGEGDQRDLVENIGYDSNAKERDGIINEVMRRLRPRTKADQRQKKFRELMSESPLLDLTEYGRAVHAEMEALLACARSGVSPLGGTLYSTTFPCHNCTRHMVGAGLERVVYIEPYSKSRASQLHSDSIAMGEESDHATAGREAGSRLQFEPFVGIGPRRYFDLFSLKLSTGYPIERKAKESFLKATWNRETAHPRIPMLPMSYLERESVAVTEYDDALGSIARQE